MNTRELALDMLMEQDQGKEYSSVLLREVLGKYDYLDSQEKSFLKRLTEGTVERRITLDYVLNRYSKTPVQKMKPLIRSLLRLSVYQLLYMDAIPDSAVCNEAVKLAEKRHFFALKGFVNGVLRTIAREKEHIVWPDAATAPMQALSVETSMPEQVLQLWKQDYGWEKTAQMARALLTVRPVCVRMEESLTKQERQSLLQQWKHDGVQAVSSPYDASAFYLEGLEGMTHLSGFAEGQVTVQDVSSMLVGRCANLKKDDFVLDVCGAPGGKAMHAAAILNRFGGGTVETRDVSAYKTDLIRENAERMHLTNLQVRVFDACETDESMIGKADVLYLDVPCSGLGIIGHKRDIKYRMNDAAMQELKTLQQRIITTCLPYVKQGGRVIYSTCTIHRAENEDMAAWMQQEFGLQAESLDPCLPVCLQNEETARGMLQLFPGEQDCDGFFIAGFRKQ